MSQDLLSFRPVGFEPIDAAWWPVIAASLPLPWPQEAALMDVRWWVGQARATQQQRTPARLPGRPTLAARWGWTDWEVKKLLRGEEWVDAWRDDENAGEEAPSPESASVPPAFRQRSASEPPADERTNADKYEESASVPPAFRQRSASEPPRAFSYTDPPITDHRSESPPDPPPADAGATPPDPQPEESPRPASARPRPDAGATRKAPNSPQEARTAIDPTPSPSAPESPVWEASRAVCVDSPQDRLPSWVPTARDAGCSRSDALAAIAGCLEALRGAPVNLDRCATDARELLGLWRALDRPPLVALAADVRLVIDAARTCPDPVFARDIRAEGWAQGRDRSRSMATLCRRDRWAERLEVARAWDARGRTEARRPPARASPPGRRASIVEMFSDPHPDVIDVEATPTPSARC